MLTPEVQTRQDIDAQLCAAGWQIQDYKKVNLAAGRGIALREVPLKNGTCDYLLLADGQPVGVIEAKKVGMTLSGVAEQSGSYAANLPDFLAEQLSRGLKKLPFAYEFTVVETFSTTSATRIRARATHLRQSILQKAFSGGF